MPSESLPQFSEACAAWLDDVEHHLDTTWDPLESQACLEEIVRKLAPAVLARLAKSLQAAQAAGVLNEQQSATLTLHLSALSTRGLALHQPLATPLVRLPTLRHLLTDLYGLAAIAPQLWATQTTTPDDLQRQGDQALVEFDSFAGQVLALEREPAARDGASRWLIQEIYATAPAEARARRLAETHPELLAVARRICEIHPDTTGQVLAWAHYVQEYEHARPAAASQGVVVDSRGRKIHPLHWLFFAVFIALCVYHLGWR